MYWNFHRQALLFYPKHNVSLSLDYILSLSQELLQFFNHFLRAILIISLSGTLFGVMYFVGIYKIK